MVQARILRGHPCVVRVANVGHHLAVNNSSWLVSRIGGFGPRTEQRLYDRVGGRVADEIPDPGLRHPVELHRERRRRVGPGCGEGETVYVCVCVGVCVCGGGSGMRR